MVDQYLEHNSQEMTSAAYDLESLSRRIWSLRFEHAWEFEGYEESGHRVVIAHWQSQYELWADTVLDIQEGDSAASMFAVHRASSSGSTAPGTNTSSFPMATPLDGSTQPGTYNQSQQPSYQEMDLNPPSQAPLQTQQGFANQNPMMNQNIPVGQTAQSMPGQQYKTLGALPGKFPVSNPPPASGSVIQQSPPFQQQPMTPPPQQMGPGQLGPIQAQNRPPLNVQNGPSAVGAGTPNNQGTPQNNQPIVQRGPFQQVPPQQSGQQFQTGPLPSPQQLPYAQYAGQRPPSRPNSANSLPQGQMSQMSLGRTQPPRSEGFPSQGPQGLQPGGR